MKKASSTKRALLVSALAMLACVAMLIGTTFAWFTDTASTGVNKIVSGNLDVELSYKKTADGDFAKATTNTKVFDENALWEPGYVEYVVLKVENAGTLALKYKLGVNIASETGSTNVFDNAFKLSDYIRFAVLDGDQSAKTRDELVTAAGEGDVLNTGYTSEEKNLSAAGTDDAAQVVTLVVWMPTSVGNEANHKTGVDAPSIDLGVKVVATQYTEERDSFDEKYDENAEYPVLVTGAVKTDEDTVLSDKPEDYELKLVAPVGSLPESAKELSLIKADAETPSNITVVTGTEALSTEVKLVDQNGDKVSAVDGQFFTLHMQLEKDKNVIGFYHNDTPLTKAESVDALTANDMYYYDAATGILTFTTDDFSPFTVVVSDSYFNGGDGTAAAPYLIATGEQAYNMRNAKGYFKLMDDVVVTNEIYLSSKTYVLDLNGHSIKLEYGEGVKPNNGGVLNVSGKKGSLTINDSSEAQTGAVYGSDKSYANKVTSAVRVGNYGKLTINGGHFYGMSEATSCIFVMTSTASGSKATVVINGGSFETVSPLNGTYYVLNHQDGASTGCTITVNGGSFKNYNPGVTSVDPVNAKTGKVVLGEGCTTTSEEIDGATWYTVSK